MKKLFSTSLAVLAICLVFSSCSKDDSDPLEKTTDTETGTFEIMIDGSLYAEGTASEVGLLMDIEGNYTNVLSMSEESTSIVASSFPVEVGASVDMTLESDPGLIIVGEKMYGTVSGTLTRTSETKISFEGKCVEVLQDVEYSISGYMETEVLKRID